MGAVSQQAGSAPGHGRGWRTRLDATLIDAGRRSGAAVVAVTLAAAASAGAAYVIATSDHTPDPGVTAALTVITACAFVFSGLVAWRRRPENRIGVLMVVTGFLWFLSALPSSSVGVLFTVGYATASWAKAVFTQTVLAYPEGRLHSRLERTLIAALYLDVVVGQFVTLTFTPLPWNLALVHGDAEVARELLRAQRWFGFAIVAAALLVLGLRLRRGSAPLRRAIVPVLATGALTLVLAEATIVANELGSPRAVELNLARGCFSLYGLVTEGSTLRCASVLTSETRAILRRMVTRDGHGQHSDGITGQPSRAIAVGVARMARISVRSRSLKRSVAGRIPLNHAV